jgi:hypothetical protein
LPPRRFVAYLSSLTNLKFSATQYALLSSIMLLLPRLIGGYSGVMVEKFGYHNFFLITCMLGVPTLLLIALHWYQEKSADSLESAGRRLTEPPLVAVASLLAKKSQTPRLPPVSRVIVDDLREQARAYKQLCVLIPVRRQFAPVQSQVTSSPSNRQRPTMRTSQYLLATLKETPSDAVVISHQLMLRAGMIRKLASGLYTWLPMGLKVMRKVEAIVREEMNAAGLWKC